MSFREKSAWISFFTVLIVFGFYFYRTIAYFIENPNANPFEDRELITLFWYSLIAFAALEIVLHVAIAIQSPKEARTAKDERERLIALKAARIAYGAISVGAVLAAVFIVHHPPNPWGLGNVVLLVVVVGEVVRFGSQIAYFRWGA